MGQHIEKDFFAGNVGQADVADDKVWPRRAQAIESLLSRAPPNGVVTLQLEAVHEGSAHHRIVFNNSDKRAFMRHDALRRPRQEASRRRVSRRRPLDDRGSLKPLDQSARGPQPKTFATAGGGPGLCRRVEEHRHILRKARTFVGHCDPK